jgi:hypothetical protein
MTPTFLDGATIDAVVGAGDDGALLPIAGPGHDRTLTEQEWTAGLSRARVGVVPRSEQRRLGTGHDTSLRLTCL